MKRWLVIVGCVVLASCAQPPQRETVTICDGGGCREQGRDVVTQETRTFNEADDGRAAALEAIAEQDPRAAYDLGLRYFRGDGVRQDSYKALTWMRSAAERGHLEAQKALGRFYLTGLEEMGPDPREAEKWLSITAGRGDAEARTLLAEASAARKSEEAEWKWRQRWRGVFYDYWYRRYTYLGYWRDGYWYYR
ncbi:MULTISPECIES: tetratricopeptide repeat protein [unclassified Thauera]|uniref:tetratricopeptide repeat protein n=1 Tax=unclassified Thauera TaxID=2609274 RepID=UPI001E4E8686|nr:MULTISPECIES: tetratricopeptide repeat protein [unclassified Thauera]HNR62090.1 tetratricopeptide repeat protein [Thauera sp.]HNS91945.1 tetratricopeptide repeat protein [Thauera sp.]